MGLYLYRSDDECDVFHVHAHTGSLTDNIMDQITSAISQMCNF